MWMSILCLSCLVVYSVAQSDEQLATISTENPNVRQGILDKMNECRRNVDPTASNMLIMIWSEEAAATAKKWALFCTGEHSLPGNRTMADGTVCGENIFKASYIAFWNEAIYAFWVERSNFVYGTGPIPGTVSGHYTQLVSYYSYKVGCYVAFCPLAEYKYFYVCHQCPAGNVEPILYPYASGPPCGQCPNNCNNGLCTNPCTYKNKYANCPSMKDMCSNTQVQTACEGTCKCKTEIV